MRPTFSIEHSAFSIITRSPVTPKPASPGRIKTTQVVVAQVSKPAVSPISKSAVPRTCASFAGSETRDTADLEVRATGLPVKYPGWRCAVKCALVPMSASKESETDRQADCLRYFPLSFVKCWKIIRSQFFRLTQNRHPVNRRVNN